MGKQRIYAGFVAGVVEDQFFSLVVAGNSSVGMDSDGSGWIFAEFENGDICQISSGQQRDEGEEYTRSTLKH